MKKNFFSKLQSAITLFDFLSENIEILKQIPNGEALHATLGEAIRQVQMHDEQQQEPDSLQKEKKNARLLLNDHMLFASEKMVAYADDIHDEALLKRVSYKPSELKMYRELEIQHESSWLYNLINEKLNALKLYKLNEETQALFLTARTNYSKLVPIIEVERQNQKDIRKQIIADIDELDKILKKIDMRVNMVRTEEPRFYNVYYSLRVAHVSYSTLALQAFVTDADNGSAIQNAEIQFLRNGKLVVLKTTTSMGAFRLAKLEPAIYEIIVSKLGYQDVKQSIVVTGDDTYILEIELTKA